MKHLLTTHNCLISLLVLLTLSSCRTSKHERQETVQSMHADTAHYAQTTRNVHDSTATLTWLSIDTLEVWLSSPARPDSAAAIIQSQSPRAIKVRARNLRLSRAETSSSRATQDSLLAQHQTSELTTSEVASSQTKPSSFFATSTFIWSIANLALLAILAFLLYRYHRNNKTNTQ